MDHPITIFNDDFIKLSFTWALCLKQLAVILPLIGIAVGIFRIDAAQKERSELERQSRWDKAYQENQRRALIAIEKDKQKDRIRNERALERKKRIDDALSNRSESTKIKTCRQCGGVYGTGSTCQFCGQP